MMAKEIQLIDANGVKIYPLTSSIICKDISITISANVDYFYFDIPSGYTFICGWFAKQFYDRTDIIHGWSFANSSLTRGIGFVLSAPTSSQTKTLRAILFKQATS